MMSTARTADRLLRLHRPTQSEFRRAVKASRLVVITGLSRELSRGGSYSLDDLQNAIGEHRVEVDRRASRNTPQDPEARPNFERIPFAELRARIESEAYAGPRTYLQDDVRNLPSFHSSYQVPTYLRNTAIVRTKLWVSGKGIVTPLHYDPVEVLHWMMEGSKRWLCFQPGLRNFYPHGVHTKAPMFSKVDPTAPDMSAYPRWKHVRPIEFELHAGELLYIPAFYWHHVESTADHNVSMNYIWLASPWKNTRYFPEFVQAMPFVAWQAKKIASVRSRHSGRS
ncbi:cupin-like domain-containing protein [Kribbella sp. NPDC023855]|uniref:cupin-like domain-containing protein n=1 Tax=Kribbella sp. NPDC023855 TaxID=3154698 RepID=UPI003405134C